jgi:hypothetical protein
VAIEQRRIEEMELIEELTKNLGVTQDQAQGGTGLILNMAKEKLGQDFSKVSGSIPGVGSLMSAAPESGGGTLGGLAKMAGAFGGGSQLANLAGLAGGFSKLGMNSGMITKFIPIIISFVQSKGGSTAADLLAKALK